MFPLVLYDVPLFGAHSAWRSQIPISITGCIITQHREAGESTPVKVTVGEWSDIDQSKCHFISYFTRRFGLHDIRPKGWKEISCRSHKVDINSQIILSPGQIKWLLKLARTNVPEANA